MFNLMIFYEKKTPSIFSAIKKLFALLDKDARLKWLGIIGFALMVSLLEVFTASVIVIFAQVLTDPNVIQNYSDKISILNELSIKDSILYMALFVGFVFSLKSLVSTFEVFFQNFSIQKMNYEFKNQLINRYGQSDYGFYLTRNSSYCMQVIGSDVEKAFTSAMVSVAGILSESIVFIFLVILVVSMNPMVALLVFVITFTLMFFISKTLLPRFYNWGEKLQSTNIKTHQSLLEFFHGFKEIILFGKNDYFINNFKYNSGISSKVQAIQSSINSVPRIGIETLFIGLFVLTISYLTVSYENPAEIVGVMSGYLYVGFRLMPGLNRIIYQLNNLKSIIPSINRIHEEYFINTGKHNYIDIPKFNFDKSISIKNLSFKYSNSDKNTFSSFNLEIKKGEYIGIVGKTGSGKSTLVDLILGLLKPSSGSILIDEHYPANSYQWAETVGYVPQSVYLTDGTIESNIAFGEKQIDETKLNQAIDTAQLRKLLNSLENGVKYNIGERGTRLSGGERQRIAIARALYKQPEVLIFDEATSALDNYTEKKLIDTINIISKKKTIIMIAHRLSSLQSCERIIEIKNGKIYKTSCYKELIAEYSESNKNESQKI